MVYKRITTETVSMKTLFDNIGVPDAENATMAVPFPLNVKTPYGYKKIVTAFRTEEQPSATTYFRNKSTLKTSEHHLLRVNGDWKKVRDIDGSDMVETETGTTSVVRKHVGKCEILYDVSVEDVHCYYSNGIVSHNSWLLAHLGAEAMRAGYNVAHFTLELNENYVGLRYDCCFTKIDFQNIRNHKPQVVEMVSKIPGKLKVKYFPLKTVSSQSLKFHIERIQMLEGYPIHMMVVDYADILRPVDKDKNANSYSEMGNIYEELRGAAGELKIPCWTASQTNRGGASEDIIQADNISDSYRKIMTADFVLSMSRKVNDKLNNTARFHVIKNRFGPDGITLYSKMNASNGDIEVYADNSVEASGIKALMQDDENDTKSMLKQKWKSFRSDDVGNNPNQ